MSKLVYIGFAFKHHQFTHAGYQFIGEYVKYDYKINIQWYYDFYFFSLKFKNSKIKYILSIINRLLQCIYIFQCILLNIFNKDLVFHFIYGENSYLNFKKFLRKTNKIVCTFHQPFTWFQKPKWINRIKSIDSIILLSCNEMSNFKKITEKDNIHYIPHGIDTSFYKIDKTVKKEHLILTVGNWLRDYELANKVYQQLINTDPSLYITVVASKESLSKIEENKHITLKYNISDEELLNLYQKCSVLFLPLIRFTANNALLEAAATGCSIVIASDYTDNCYIPSNLFSQCKLSVNDTIKCIKECYSKDPNYQLAEFIKDNYSWSKIGLKTEELLKSL